MRIVTVLFLSLIVGIFTSCSDEEHYPEVKGQEIHKTFPLIPYDLSKLGIEYKDFQSLPLLINSTQELNETLKKYKEPENEEFSNIDFENYSLILVFLGTIFSDIDLGHTFELSKESKNSDEVYIYTLTLNESGKLPDNEVNCFYTGILVEKLANSTPLKFMREDLYE